MKKLMLLLFIPLVFTCSSDSDEDEQNVTFKDYLTTNVFVRDALSSSQTGAEYPFEVFMQFTFEEEAGVSTLFSSEPYNVCTSDVTYNTCFQTSTIDSQGFLTLENTDRLIWEHISTGNLLEITLNANSTIDVKRMFTWTEDSWSHTYTLTDIDYLNQRKQELNNSLCPCSN